MRRAFVIQFDRSTSDKQCCGRIEHVQSGRRRHFESLAEAESFARQILKQVDADEADKEQATAVTNSPEAGI